MKTEKEIIENRILLSLLVDVNRNILEDAFEQENQYIIDSSYYQKIHFLINKISEIGFM